MFLVFIPTPYVDASTAWGFPNKWHRDLRRRGRHDRRAVLRRAVRVRLGMSATRTAASSGSSRSTRCWSPASRRSSSTPTRCSVTTATTSCPTGSRSRTSGRRAREYTLGPDQAAPVPREAAAAAAAGRPAVLAVRLLLSQSSIYRDVRRHHDHAAGRVPDPDPRHADGARRRRSPGWRAGLQDVQVPRDRAGTAPQARPGDGVHAGRRVGDRGRGRADPRSRSTSTRWAIVEPADRADRLGRDDRLRRREVHGQGRRQW